MTPRLGILISGRGSNMVAILDAIAAGRIDAKAAIVVSNDPTAKGLETAAAQGIETAGFDHRSFETREAFDAAAHAALTAAGVDLVICAGFMRIMTPVLIAPWTGRMLNIHPSLLPAFRGLNTFQRALEAGCAVAGCTVHEVTQELDAGRILGQGVVPVLPGDTASSLDQRILPLQHRLYPAVVSAFIRDAEGLRRAPMAMLAGFGTQPLDQAAP
ncbi:MAG: phosphoribosylglycinamide formyltransferase [Pseudomonadota bacterium]